MPPFRRRFSAHIQPFPHNRRMARVALGELPFKQKNGELLRERARLFRPIPACEWEDKENDDAALQAAEENNEILDELEAARARYDINTLIATQVPEGPRLSMPTLDYDGSSSEPEPDDSILHARARPMAAQAAHATPAAVAAQIESSFNADRAAQEEDEALDQRSLSPEEYEDENLNIEEEDDDEEGDEDGADEDQAQDVAPPFDPATAGLKEISNLARFTVSSHKPGHGVEELKSDDLKHFWQ